MAPNGSDVNAGTESAPVKSLRRAVSLVSAGGTIVLRGGDHRTWYSNSSGTDYEIVGKDLNIQAYPGERPWLNGADVVGSWAIDGGGRWSRSWDTPSFCDGEYYQYPPTAQNPSNIGPCTHTDMYRDPAYPMAGDPQMAFVDGEPLRQVGSLSQVVEGTFFYDWSARRITIGTNPASRTVELSARPVALVLGGGRNYTVRGIGFRRYASNEYSNLTSSALYIGANSSTVENTVFTQNAGKGLMFSNPRNGTSVTKSVFANNGFNGMDANGASKSGTRNDFLVESNLFSGNNVERFGVGCTISCAAANVKLTHMVGFTVRNNIFESARGVGIGFWCDLDCREGVIVRNLVRNNGGHGIYYEVSSGGIIASNLVTGNAQVGIAISSASTKVFNNSIVIDAVRQPKAQGIWVYDDARTPSVPGGIGPNTAGVELINNIVSGPKGVFVKAVNGSGGAGNTVTSQYFSQFDSNAYHHSGQNIYNWLDPSTGTYYRSSASFFGAIGWDRTGIDFNSSVDPFFVDAVGGDYRVRSNSPARNAGRTLPADVAAALGLGAGAPIDRGAIVWPAPPS